MGGVIEIKGVAGRSDGLDRVGSDEGSKFNGSLGTGWYFLWFFLVAFEGVNWDLF